MYYNAQDLVTFAPGHYAGRATATSLTGPWIKSEKPVISSGHAGEWDAGFIIPSSVLNLDDGSYVMFYSGGEDIPLFDNFYVGMATSTDGIKWKKYNDPATIDHPYAESDPVLMPAILFSVVSWQSVAGNEKSAIIRNYEETNIQYCLKFISPGLISLQ